MAEVRVSLVYAGKLLVLLNHCGVIIYTLVSTN